MVRISGGEMGERGETGKGLGGGSGESRGVD